MNIAPTSPSLFSQLLSSAKSSIQTMMHTDNTTPNVSDTNESYEHQQLRFKQQQHLEELKQQQRQQIQERSNETRLESLAIEHDDGSSKYQFSVPVGDNIDTSSSTNTRFHFDNPDDNLNMKLHPSFPNDPTAPAPGEPLNQYETPKSQHQPEREQPTQHIRQYHQTSNIASTTVSPSHTNNWGTQESAPSSPQYSVYSSTVNSVTATPAGGSPRTRQGSFVFSTPGQIGVGQGMITVAERRRMSMGDVEQYEKHHSTQQYSTHSSGSVDDSTVRTSQNQFQSPTFHAEGSTDSSTAPHPYYTPQQRNARRLTAPTLVTVENTITSSSSTSTGTTPIPSPFASSAPPPHPSTYALRRNSLINPALNIEEENESQLAADQYTPKLQSPPQTQPQQPSHPYTNGHGNGHTDSSRATLPRPDFLSLGDPREPSELLLPSSHPQAAKLNEWAEMNRRLQAQAYAQDQAEMQAINQKRH